MKAIHCAIHMFIALFLLLPLTACAAGPSPTPGNPTPVASKSEPIEQQVQDLLAQMTLEEKIGQMTQVEKNAIDPAEVTQYFIGSVLSGGGGYPFENTPAAWVEMVNGYQDAALATRLKIPMLYGVDAVHGHNNLYGAVIFPHNVGLGAANDPQLVKKIGAATAEELAATGVRWNFAPMVAVVQDIRWGRTYEGFGENTDLVSSLGAAYILGQQNAGDSGLAISPSVLATPKHYIGDGATVWGTSTSRGYSIDQGDMQLDEATLREVLLPPYQAAIQAGAECVMVSFSSWQGVKMHAHKYLVTDVLKGELGFQGFVVSDWQAIDQIPGDYYSDVVTSINTGIDMVMVPVKYETFITTLRQAVENGDVPIERIDDAVRRILTVKYHLGLFETPYTDPALLETIGSDAHRALAREAVAKSLVLLKNDNQALPAAKDTPLIYIGGASANNIGNMNGGWTIEWQGKSGDITPGTTILEAVQGAVSPETRVEYNLKGEFETGQKAELGIAVVGETPYAEGSGDRGDLALSPADQKLIATMREHCEKLVVIIISGRPLIITDQLAQADAWVAAWLPGTEGQGITDVLFGDQPFTGKLPYTWPASMDQLPLGPVYPQAATQKPLFPYGYGLEK